MLGVGITAMGSCSVTENGLNSDSNEDKWRFIMKDQGEDEWMKNN